MHTVPEDLLRSKFTADPVNGCVYGSSGNSVGWLTRDGYMTVGFMHEGKRVRIRRARLIWFLCTGKWPDEIDHINRNSTDDRLVNLRDVNRQTNSLNTCRSKVNPFTGEKQ